MIRKIYTLLILGLCLGFAACGDDNDGLDPNAAAPVILSLIHISEPTRP